MDVLSHPPIAPALPAVLGDFTVVAQLREGGSGVVYAVTLQGAALALKVLRPDLELSTREIKAFLVEAERMRRVAHPSLVPVIDAGDAARRSSLPGDAAPPRRVARAAAHARLAHFPRRLAS